MALTMVNSMDVNGDKKIGNNGVNSIVVKTQWRIRNNRGYTGYDAWIMSITMLHTKHGGL